MSRTDTATCRLDDRAGDMLDGTDGAGGLGFAVVVGERRVVLGKLLLRDAHERPDAAVEDLMVEGPSTVRASADPDELLERMRAAKTGSVLVTTKEGRLVGVAAVDDLAAAVDTNGTPQA